MGSSFKLFSIRGIDVRLHITFPLILVYGGLMYGLRTGTLESALFGIVGFAFLFVLVTLHELGHSFAAQYYGVPVKQIILSPLGGIAQLSEIPENPVQEFVIAVAGPAVNVAIFLLMGIAALAAGFDPGNVLAAASSFTVFTGFTFGALFTFVFFYNIILALFNLIPAFPLDGGRIFRSLLALKLEYVRATVVASTIGQVIALLLGLFGIMNGAMFTVFIAVFIFMAARQETQMVRARSLLRSIKVQQVFSRSVYVLKPESTVQQATNMVIFGNQRNFAIVDDDWLVGFVPHENLVGAMRTAAPHSFISTVMRSDIEPVSPDDELFDVLRRMESLSVEALPVASDGRFLGQISRRQIAGARHVQQVAPNAMPREQSA